MFCCLVQHLIVLKLLNNEIYGKLRQVMEVAQIARVNQNNRWQKDPKCQAVDSRDSALKMLATHITGFFFIFVM